MRELLALADPAGVMGAALITGLCGLTGIVLSILFDRSRRRAGEPEPEPPDQTTEDELRAELRTRAIAAERRCRGLEREVGRVRAAFDRQMSLKRTEEKRLRALVIKGGHDPDTGRLIGGSDAPIA